MDFIKKEIKAWEIKQGQISITGKNGRLARILFESIIDKKFNLYTHKGNFENRVFNPNDQYSLRFSCRAFFKKLSPGDQVFIWFSSRGIEIDEKQPIALSIKPQHYLLGTSYSGKSIYQDLVDQKVISIGFCWNRSMVDLYNQDEGMIIQILQKEKFKSKEYSAHKKFLQIKPGDIIALKTKGWPAGKKAFLEIAAYAQVVERDGVVYFHDPEGLGHCINVEYIQTDIFENKELGYGETIYHITDEDRIEKIFGKYKSKNEKGIRGRIRNKRKRKGTTKRTKGKQKRSGSKPYVADLRHNAIQELFYEDLKNRFPKEKVSMEEDFVDVKQEGVKEIILFEVKPFAWAEDCIREGLGQLLSYTFALETEKTVKLAVVGPYAPTKEELKFISFIQTQLRIDFEYIQFEI